MSHSWSYSGETGPDYWSTLCPEFYEASCYEFQSPISLHHDQLKAESQQLSFHYQETSFQVEETKGTVHFVPNQAHCFVALEDEYYTLTDIHFHRPSEHVIDDRQEDLEFHLVHKNKKGQPLVCALLFHLTAGKKAARERKDVLTFDPTVFLPDSPHFFHYQGSLTTPPTNGPVEWIVFDSCQKMEEDQLKPYQTERIPNNRPLQALKGRKIYYH